MENNLTIKTTIPPLPRYVGTPPGLSPAFGTLIPCSPDSLPSQIRRAESPPTAGRNPLMPRFLLLPPSSALCLLSSPFCPVPPSCHSTLVENPLQIGLFAQNKPNPKNPKTNATLFAAKNYEERPPSTDLKKQTQSNPILSRPSPHHLEAQRKSRSIGVGPKWKSRPVGEVSCLTYHPSTYPRAYEAPLYPRPYEAPLYPCAYEALMQNKPNPQNPKKGARLA